MMPTRLIFDEKPFAEPTVIEVPPGIVSATSRHGGVTLEQLPAIFDAGFKKLALCNPIGPGFAVYLGDPQVTFDLVIGFPIAGRVSLDGVDQGEFPSGRALVLSHIGGYDGLGAAWGRLMSSYVERSSGTARLVAEVYVTDPSVTKADVLRTDLLVFANDLPGS